MPTIHAVAGPAKACATTRVRCSGSLQAAVAATPAVRIVAIPIHIGICASASSANDGAAALASEPTARSALATPSSARGEYRVSSRPATSAATTASGAARIRSCPAAAIETPKSSATSLRIGDSTSTPAWLARNARKRTRMATGARRNGRSRGRGRRCTGTASAMPETFVTPGGQCDAAGTSPACGKPNRPLAPRLLLGDAARGRSRFPDTRTNAGVDDVGVYRKLHVSTLHPIASSCSSRRGTWRRR
jgi:hypothetical protein